MSILKKDENLPELFKNACNMLQLEPIDFKSIFRVTNMKTARNFPDPTIVVNLFKPYEKNFFLKISSEFIRANKKQLTLNMIGFGGNVSFYVNENRTPHNYKILLLQ